MFLKLLGKAKALFCFAGDCMEKWTPQNAVSRLQSELNGVEAKVEVSQGPNHGTWLSQG